MDGVSSFKSEWTLTAPAFAGFLACLDSDNERAGQKYENLRLMLIKFFDWRGAHFPEECADETINRVIRKIEAGETIRDIPTFCHGVARLVFLETLKSPESRKANIDDISEARLSTPVVEEIGDDRQECFESCLQELPLESRQLILQYYSDEKRDKINNRLALATRLGIPLNALRSRVQRIRDKLEQCVNHCRGQEPT